MPINEVAFKKWYKNSKNAVYPMSSTAREKERAAKIKQEEELSKKDAEIAAKQAEIDRKNTALRKAKVSSREFNLLKEKLKDRKPTLVLKNPVESIAESVRKIATIPPTEPVDIEPIVSIHSALMTQLINEIEKIADRPNPPGNTEINGLISRVATELEKIAKVSVPLDTTEITRTIDGSMTRLIGEIKGLPRSETPSNSWQKIEMHFQRDKQGVISDAIIERIK